LEIAYNQRKKTLKISLQSDFPVQVIYIVKGVCLTCHMSERKIFGKPRKEGDPESKQATTSAERSSVYEQLFGYQHQNMDEIRSAAAMAYEAAAGPFGISQSAGYSEIWDDGLKPTVEEIKSEAGGGVFVSLGHGLGSDVRIGRMVGASTIIEVDIQTPTSLEIGQKRETEIQDTCLLEIRDDIVVALAKMHSETVDVIYYRALDNFRGNLRMLLQEIERVLKPGGFIIEDGQTWFWTRPEWEEVNESFELFSEGDARLTVIFRKNSPEQREATD